MHGWDGFSLTPRAYEDLSLIPRACGDLSLRPRACVNLSLRPRACVDLSLRPGACAKQSVLIFFSVSPADGIDIFPNVCSSPYLLKNKKHRMEDALFPYHKPPQIPASVWWCYALNSWISPLELLPILPFVAIYHSSHQSMSNVLQMKTE